MAFSYLRSKLPRIGNSPSTPQTCPIFHYPNPQIQSRALSGTRPCMHTELDDFSVPQPHYCVKPSSLGRLVGGSLPIMNLNRCSELWNSVTRRISPTRSRCSPAYVVTMSSYSTSSRTTNPQKTGGPLGNVPKITQVSPKRKSSLLLALHHLKLELSRVCGDDYDAGVASLNIWNWWIQKTLPKFNLHRFGLVTTLFFTRLKRIPYCNRYHFIPAPSTGLDLVARRMGDGRLKELKESFKGCILPPDSPQTIRVKSVLEDIVQAMHSGLKLPESRKRLSRFDTEHLEGMKWEVMVVHGQGFIYFFPNGTVVVTASFLETLQSDAELAAILAHEVGHEVARHCLEHISRCLRIFAFMPLLMFIPYSKVPLALVFSFISRRREMEADYIGLMLMASAGYDPEVVPALCEAHADDPSPSLDIFASHPSGRERAKQLKRPKVMKQAVAIYKEVKSGHGVRNFV